MKWHRIKAMLRDYYYYSITSVDRIFDVLYWPVIDIVIWGFMMTYIQGITEMNLVSMILGGMILWVFVWRGGQDIVVYTLEHYWSRSIYHLFVSPLRKSELMVSLCILSLLRGLISFLVLTGLAMLLYQLNFFSFNLLHMAFFISLLLLFGWGMGMLVGASVFIWGSRVQVLAWSSIWIVQPFSCVFYPLTALPPWAASIAKWLPTTQIFEGMRASLAGMPLDWTRLGYAALGIVVFLGVSILIFVASITAARKSGAFAKPE